MLQRFPGVRRWEETMDLVQSATLRLLRALGEVNTESTRAFFGLAAEQIRRELLDLARHYRGPRGLGANYASAARRAIGPDGSAGGEEPANPLGLLEDLDRWTEFHEAVERLPAEEREVIKLSFYHGWTQSKIGALLGVSERTVRRYWQAACLKLHDSLGGELPDV
jgi:RNA polymerase sigma-70 factor (ECF subfamily)